MSHPRPQAAPMVQQQAARDMILGIGCRQMPRPLKWPRTSLKQWSSLESTRRPKNALYFAPSIRKLDERTTLASFSLNCEVCTTGYLVMREKGVAAYE